MKTIGILFALMLAIPTTSFANNTVVEWKCEITKADGTWKETTRSDARPEVKSWISSTDGKMVVSIRIYFGASNFIHNGAFITGDKITENKRTLKLVSDGPDFEYNTFILDKKSGKVKIKITEGFLFFYTTLANVEMNCSKTPY